MATTPAMLNPYQPVSVERRFAVACRFNPLADLHCDVERRWLVRRIQLRGLVETDLFWDARSATEYVTVGGVRAASQVSFLYVPRFEFEIANGTRVLNAAIDVRIAWMVKVIAFQLVVDGHVIYREGIL